MSDRDLRDRIAALVREHARTSQRPFEPGTTPVGYAGRVFERDYAHRDPRVALQRFTEMARFNYGSTVIVLLPKGVAALAPGLVAETPVRLGTRLATRL